MEVSSRLGLPLLVAGQAQKEIAHNEALLILDGYVAACVEERSSATPPVSPTAGSCYLVAEGAGGAWSGRARQLAMATSGGWRFVVPQDGMRVWVAGEAIDATFREGAWEYGAVRGERVLVGGQQVVGARAAAIAGPSGGATVDAECRTAVAALLAAVRGHGLIAE